MFSSHNPFRTPGVTPQPTGTSTASSANPFGSDEPTPHTLSSFSSPPSHLRTSSLSQLSSPASPSQPPFANGPSFPAPGFPSPNIPSGLGSFSSTSQFGSPSGAPPPHLRGSSPASSDSSSEGDHREDLPELRFPELSLEDTSPPPSLPPRTNTLSNPSGPPPLPARSPTGPTPPTLPPRGDTFGPPPGAPPPSTRPSDFSPPPNPPPSFSLPPGPPPSSQSFSPPPRPYPSSSPSFSPPSGPPPRAPTRADSLGPPPGSPPPSVVQQAATPRQLTPPPEIDEELPAYSATPDAAQGEESVDFGPRRPFQRAPPQGQNPLSQTQQQQARPTHYPPPPAPPGVGWAPQFYQQNLAPPSQPPPRARSVSPSPRPAANPAPSRPLSDFARDFYAAGGDSSGAEQASASTSAQPRYAPPPGEPPSASGSSHPRYAPPPGQPPLRRTASNVGPPSSSTGLGGANLGRSVSANHGQPTTSPTPGHPLLNNGQTLVYPEGYVCTKCRNTGYKNYDPSHPCRRCWDRYSRPFSTAFARLWGSSANTQPQNQQRPLPNFSAPRGAPGTPSTSVPEHRRASSTSTPTSSGAAQVPLTRSTTTPRQPPPPSRPLVQRSPTRTVAMSTGGRPPPGATVVRPGDPRIGGRLCWRCDGRGWHSFLLFDEVTCEVCEGLGRTGVPR